MTQFILYYSFQDGDHLQMSDPDILRRSLHWNNKKNYNGFSHFKLVHDAGPTVKQHRLNVLCLLVCIADTLSSFSWRKIFLLDLFDWKNWLKLSISHKIFLVAFIGLKTCLNLKFSVAWSCVSLLRSTTSSKKNYYRHSRPRVKQY